jgi:ABC-type lipoprotein export system ATPase subunit
MNYPQGSLWHKWDLHVHTPSSIVNYYGGDNDHVWDLYIRDLEALPAHYKVIGVNDYIFIDGYRRLLKEKAKGRMGNIDLLLPVIELRVDKFGGSSSKLKRVNYHVIFSDELSPDIIEQQFLFGLRTKYVITPQYAPRATSWTGVITPQNLESLGSLIINSVPAAEKAKFLSPIAEGFNNLNLSMVNIEDCLANPVFKDKYVTAVGKTEWAEVNWGESTIAEKKNIINSVHCVFIAAYTREDHQKAKDSLSAQKVNDRLLDCSDAHYLASSLEKDRIGNCFTWIKADTTFEGLRQALIEYDERVFTGDTPLKLQDVILNKTKYMKSLSIKKDKKAALQERWFDADIELNHGLISIIGNKGGGKSALADVIGLLGNSRTEKWFSFLNQYKFRKPGEDKSQYFTASLEWASNDVLQMNLAQHTTETQTERLKYIPQDYFEVICNELGDVDKSQFDKEIKQVIYSHVGKSEKLGLATLDEIIQLTTQESYEAIQALKHQIAKFNEEIQQLEDRTAEQSQKQLKSQLVDRQKELAAHRKSKPKEVVKPQGGDSSIALEVKALQEQREKLQTEIDAKEERSEELTLDITNLRKLLQMLANLDKHIAAAKGTFDEIGATVGIRFDDVVSFTASKTQINGKLSSALAEQRVIEADLDKRAAESLPKKIAGIDKKIKDVEKKLGKPEQEYQEYKSAVREWEQVEKKISGKKKDVGSITFLEAQVSDIDKIPGRLDKLHKRRASASTEIYDQLSSICDTYRSLYKPVQEFIETNPEIRDKSAMSFDVSIVNHGFVDQFFDWIHRGNTGSFYGQTEGTKVLSEIVAKYDFNIRDDVIKFIDDVLDHLAHDYNSTKKSELQLKGQLRKGKTVASLYDCIFSLEYLRPRYVLKMRGKELTELSPGERGTLLLVFYLLVDRDNMPLIIDQPEHNLDNETVYKVLVPAIRKAKAHRQIVIVTHNPNLAVVCNSDQVIWASLDIKDAYRLKYLTGAIESPEINRKLVDILEGTRPAFDNRSDKYLPSA